MSNAAAKIDKVSCKNRNTDLHFIYHNQCDVSLHLVRAHHFAH